MSNYLYSSKIKFQVEYQGMIKSTEIAPNKTIEYLIKIAKNLYFPIEKQIKILYNQTDIVPFNQRVLGEFFKRKNPIILKIVPPDFNSTIPKLNESSFLCECNKENYSNYCRNCKMYICNSCKLNVHEGHRIIELDINNLIENIKMYINILNNEMKVNLIKAENYHEKIKNEEYDISNIHQKIKDKFSKVFMIYSEMINSLKKTTNIEKIISDYKMQTKITGSEIDEILQNIYIKYTKGKRNMNIDEFKSYFNEISQKEDLLNIQSVDIYSIRVRYELNEKMKNMCDTIEQIIEKTLNKNNEFNLDTNNKYLYDLIIENNKNIKNNKEDNNEDEISNHENENNENNENNEDKENINNEIDNDNNNEDNEKEDLNNES